ncbi:hypothetical protein SNE25_09555 [Mucilaginibacter sabulilitoris]|uniref:Uncharacterized protein n=1 Tax=Mucilaginibacter sabulilitoris TaxID=1173583 RepID=A0ABZ0TUK9_9SPHI|nr:hypothetical protein [Mucilaginibacter sabulilitoris]WPU95763.1 hypothetical protein SNE25_09555 [Mucilaginibacter sabulilitoris]
MNWDQFFQAIVAVYLLYYILMIVFDMLHDKRMMKDESYVQELYLSAEDPPREVSLLAMDEVKDGPDSAIGQTALPAVSAAAGQPQRAGNVSMSQLMELSKADLIAHTKHIPY